MQRWWRFGLGLSSLYLMYCLTNKARIDHDVKGYYAEQRIEYSRYFTTPAPLQNWLWFVVAGSDSGYHVGFRSMFDSEDHRISLFPRNDSLLKPWPGRNSKADQVLAAVLYR